MFCFFFSSRRRHTRFLRDWSSDVCSSDLLLLLIKDLLPWTPLIDIRPSQAWHCSSASTFSGRVLLIAVIRAICRSEERRLGKECRSHGSRCHYKKKREE